MALRTVEELVSRDEHAWPLVRGWIDAAPHGVEVLPAARERGERALVALQVTTRSPLGAVALECVGLLVDHRWLRVLGAGGSPLGDGLAEWNAAGGDAGDAAGGGPDRLEDALVVAHDAAGGFFPLNAGAFVDEPGSTHYLAPDALEREDLGMGHTAFLRWALGGDLGSFHSGVRWERWERETAALPPDRGFSFYPFL